ncbi:phosphatidylinositol 4-kinase [Plasmodium brasilianum]|uniref:Phosphatidylinositol 4-kinase n=1 Tax=Plasmodium brasilianum TaxID=5824 RepID=A0ACB9YCZ3_PLABR|nr:phosphatidylinositol 4-kinase [Plasmodium brasilianum]
MKSNTFKDTNISSILKYIRCKKNGSKNKTVLIFYLCNALEERHIKHGKDVLVLYLSLLPLFEDNLINIFKKKVIASRRGKYYYEENKEIDIQYSIKLSKLQLYLSYIILHMSYFVSLNRNIKKNNSIKLFLYYVHILTFINLQKYICLNEQSNIYEKLFYLCYINMLISFLINIYKFKLYEILSEKKFYTVSKYIFLIINLFTHIKKNRNSEKLFICFYDYVYNVINVLLDKYGIYLKKQNGNTHDKEILVTYYKNFLIFLYNYIRKLKILKYSEKYLLNNSKNVVYNLSLLTIVKNTVDIHFLRDMCEMKCGQVIAFTLQRGTSKKKEVTPNGNVLMGEEDAARSVHNRANNRSYKRTHSRTYNSIDNKATREVRSGENLRVCVGYETVNSIVLLKILKLFEILHMRKNRVYLSIYIYNLVNKITNQTLQELYYVVRKNKQTEENHLYYNRLLYLFEYYFNILFFYITTSPNEREKNRAIYHNNSYCLYLIQSSIYFIYEIYMLLIVLLSTVRGFNVLLHSNSTSTDNPSRRSNNFDFVHKMLFLERSENIVRMNNITSLICDCVFVNSSFYTLTFLEIVYKNNEKLNFFLKHKLHTYIMKGEEVTVIINKKNTYMKKECTNMLTSHEQREQHNHDETTILVIQDHHFNMLNMNRTNLFWDAHTGLYTCVNSFVKLNFIFWKNDDSGSCVYPESNDIRGTTYRNDSVEDSGNMYRRKDENALYRGGRKKRSCEYAPKGIGSFEKKENETDIIHSNVMRSKMTNDDRWEGQNLNRPQNDKIIVDKGKYRRNERKLNGENYIDIYFPFLLNVFLSSLLRKKKKKKKSTQYNNIECNCKNYLDIYINKMHYYCNNIFNCKAIFVSNFSSFVKNSFRKRRSNNWIDNITSFNGMFSFYNNKIRNEKNKLFFKNKTFLIRSMEKKHSYSKYTFLKKMLNYKSCYFDNEKYYFNFLFNIKFLHNLNDTMNEYFLLKKNKINRKAIFSLPLNIKEKIKRMKPIPFDDYSHNHLPMTNFSMLSLDHIEERRKLSKSKLIISDILSQEWKYETRKRKKNDEKYLLYFLFVNYNYCIFNYEKNDNLEYFLLRILRCFEIIMPYVNIYKYICSFLMFLTSLLERKPLADLDVFIINRSVRAQKEVHGCTLCTSLDEAEEKVVEEVVEKVAEEMVEEAADEMAAHDMGGGKSVKWSEGMREIMSSRSMGKRRGVTQSKEKRWRGYNRSECTFNKVQFSKIMVNGIEKEYRYVERNVLKNMERMKEDNCYCIFYKSNYKIIWNIMIGIIDKIKIYLFSNTFHYLYKDKRKYHKYLSTLSLHFYRLYFTLAYYEIYKGSYWNNYDYSTSTRKEIQEIKNKIIEITPILSVRYLNIYNISNICKVDILKSIKENNLLKNDKVNINCSDINKLYLFIIYYIECNRKKEDILYSLYFLIDKYIFGNKVLHKNVKKLINYKIFVFLNDMNNFHDYNFTYATFFLLMNIMNYNKMIRNYIYYIFDQIFKLKLNTLFDSKFLTCFLKNLEKSSQDYAFSKMIHEEKKILKNSIDKKKNNMIKIIYKVNLYITINYLLFLKMQNCCKFFLNLYSYFYYEFYIFCVKKYTKKYNGYHYNRRMWDWSKSNRMDSNVKNRTKLSSRRNSMCSNVNHVGHLRRGQSSHYHERCYKRSAFDRNRSPSCHHFMAHDPIDSEEEEYNLNSKELLDGIVDSKGYIMVNMSEVFLESNELISDKGLNKENNTEEYICNSNIRLSDTIGQTHLFDKDKYVRREKHQSVVNNAERKYKRAYENLPKGVKISKHMVTYLKSNYGNNRMKSFRKKYYTSSIVENYQNYNITLAALNTTNTLFNRRRIIRGRRKMRKKQKKNSFFFESHKDFNEFFDSQENEAYGTDGADGANGIDSINGINYTNDENGAKLANNVNSGKRVNVTNATNGSNDTIDDDVNYFKILKKVKGNNTYIYNLYDIKINKRVLYNEKHFKEYLNVINFVMCIFLATNINNLNMSMLNNYYIYIISKIIKKNFKFYFFFFYYNIFKKNNKRYKNIYNINFDIILNSSFRNNLGVSKISIKNKYICVLYTLSCILTVYNYKYAFFNYYFFYFYKFVKLLAKLSVKSIFVSNFLIDKLGNEAKGRAMKGKVGKQAEDLDEAEGVTEKETTYFVDKGRNHYDLYYIDGSSNRVSESVIDYGFRSNIIFNDHFEGARKCGEGENVNPNGRSAYFSHMRREDGKGGMNGKDRKDGQLAKDLKDGKSSADNSFTQRSAHRGELRYPLKKKYSKKVKAEMGVKSIFSKEERIFIASDIMMIRSYVNDYIRMDLYVMYNNLQHNNVSNKSILDKYITLINNTLLLFVFVNHLILMYGNINIKKKKIIKYKIKWLQNYNYYLMRKIVDIYILNIPYLCNYLVVTLEFFFVFSNSFLSLNYGNFFLKKDIKFFFKNCYIYYLMNTFNKIQNLKTFYHLNHYKNYNLYFHNYKKFRHKQFSPYFKKSTLDYDKGHREDLQKRMDYSNPLHVCTSTYSNYYEMNSLNNSVIDDESEDSISDYDDYIFKDAFKDLKEIFKRKTKNYLINNFGRNMKNIFYLFDCFNDISSITLFLNLYIHGYTKIKDAYDVLPVQSINNAYLYNFRLLKLDYHFVCILFLSLIRIFNYTSSVFHAYSYFVQLYSKYKYNYFLYSDRSYSFFTFYNVYLFFISKNKLKNENLVSINNHVSSLCMSDIYDYNKLLLQKSFIFLSFFFHNFNNILPDIYCINCSNKYSIVTHDKNVFPPDLTQVCAKEGRLKGKGEEIGKESGGEEGTERMDCMNNATIREANYSITRGKMKKYYKEITHDKNKLCVAYRSYADKDKQEGFTNGINKDREDKDYHKIFFKNYGEEFINSGNERSNAEIQDQRVEEGEKEKHILNHCAKIRMGGKEEAWFDDNHMPRSDNDKWDYINYDEVIKRNDKELLEQNKANDGDMNGKVEEKAEEQKNSIFRKYRDNFFSIFKSKISDQDSKKEEEKKQQEQHHSMTVMTMQGKGKNIIPTEYGKGARNVNKLKQSSVNQNDYSGRKLRKGHSSSKEDISNCNIDRKKSIENEYDSDYFSSQKNTKNDLIILSAYKYMLRYQKRNKKSVYDYNLKEQLRCMCINKYIYICNLIYNALVYILELKYKYKYMKKKFHLFSYNTFKKKKEFNSVSTYNDQNYIILNTKHLLNYDFIILSILHLTESIYINLYKCKLFTDMCIFNNIKYVCLENKGTKKNSNDSYKNININVTNKNLQCNSFFNYKNYLNNNIDHEDYDEDDDDGDNDDGDNDDGDNDVDDNDIDDNDDGDNDDGDNDDGDNDDGDNDDSDNDVDDNDIDDNDVDDNDVDDNDVDDNDVDDGDDYNVYNSDDFSCGGSMYNSNSHSMHTVHYAGEKKKKTKTNKRKKQDRFTKASANTVPNMSNSNNSEYKYVSRKTCEQDDLHLVSNSSISDKDNIIQSSSNYFDEKSNKDDLKENNGEELYCEKEKREEDGGLLRSNCSKKKFYEKTISRKTENGKISNNRRSFKVGTKVRRKKKVDENKKDTFAGENDKFNYNNNRGISKNEKKGQVWTVIETVDTKDDSKSQGRKNGTSGTKWRGKRRKGKKDEMSKKVRVGGKGKSENGRMFFSKNSEKSNSSKRFKSLSISGYLLSVKKLAKREEMKNEMSLGYLHSCKVTAQGYEKRLSRKMKIGKKQRKQNSSDKDGEDVYSHKNIYSISHRGNTYKEGKWNIRRFFFGKKKKNSSEGKVNNDNTRINNLFVKYKSRSIKNTSVQKLLKIEIDDDKEENIERIKNLFITFNSNNKEKKINNYIHNIFNYTSPYPNFNVCYKKKFEILDYKIKVGRSLLKVLYSFYYRHNLSIFYKIYKKIEYIYTYLNLSFYTNLFTTNTKEINSDINKYSLFLLVNYLKYHIHNSDKLFNSFIVKIINFLNHNVHNITEFLCMHHFEDLLNILNQYIITININNKLSINKYNLFNLRKNKLIYVPISNVLFLHCNKFSLNDIIKILYSYPQYSLFLKSIAVNNLVYLYKKSTITNAMYLQLFEFLKVDMGNRIFFFIIFFSFHSFRFLYQFFLNMHTYIEDEYLTHLTYCEMLNNGKEGCVVAFPNGNNNICNSNNISNNKNNYNNNSVLSVFEDNIENCLLFKKELFAKKTNPFKDFLLLWTKKKNNNVSHSTSSSSSTSSFTSSMDNNNKNRKKRITKNYLNINNFIFHKYHNYVKKTHVLSLKCSLIKKLFLQNLCHKNRSALLESCRFHNTIFCMSQEASQFDKKIQLDFVRMEIQNLLNNINIKKLKLLTSNNIVSHVSDDIKILMSATRSPIFLSFKSMKQNVKKNLYLHSLLTRYAIRSRSRVSADDTKSILSLNTHDGVYNSACLMSSNTVRKNSIEGGGNIVQGDMVINNSFTSIANFCSNDEHSSSKGASNVHEQRNDGFVLPRAEEHTIDAVQRSKTSAHYSERGKISSAIDAKIARMNKNIPSLRVYDKSLIHRNFYKTKKEDNERGEDEVGEVYKADEVKGKKKQNRTNNSNKKYEDVSYIYKVNDDVRQDKLVIQIIYIFIHILSDYKLFYNLFPYNIVTNKYFNVYANEEEDNSAHKKITFIKRERKKQSNEDISNVNKETDGKRKFSFSFHLFKKAKKKQTRKKDEKQNKSCSCRSSSKEKEKSKNKKDLFHHIAETEIRDKDGIREDSEKKYPYSSEHFQNNLNLYIQEYHSTTNTKSLSVFSKKKKKKKKKKFENFGAVIEVLANTKSRHEIGRKYQNIIKFYHLKFSNINTYIYALKNFICSLAAYSLLSFILQVKDRHNGNLLFDEYGNIIHIDFGYILNIYPGISINFELAPFKLTREMITLLTMKSQKKQYFIFTYIQLVVKGYLLLREKSDWLISSILSLSHSDINCFKYNTVEKLKKRLKLNKSDNDASIFMINKIHQAYNNITTIMYDYIQNIQQGIQ